VNALATVARYRGAMTLSKRTRFEVLKRDGFRCVYCGATAVTSLLHIDHVIAIANGGTNEPPNLVTSCAGCNLGKSDVRLEESRIDPSATVDAMRERSEQVQEYLSFVRTLESAREGLRELYAGIWIDTVGRNPPRPLRNRFDILDAQHGHGDLTTAIDAVATWAGRNPDSDAIEHQRYFYGVLRNMRHKDAPAPQRFDRHAQDAIFAIAEDAAALTEATLRRVAEVTDWDLTNYPHPFMREADGEVVLHRGGHTEETATLEQIDEAFALLWRITVAAGLG
jgi:hypothetical protein